MKKHRFFQRNVPEVNATSTADMAFILLVFFLMSTSMGHRKGVEHRLSPLADSVQTQPLAVQERNLMVVRIAADGAVYCRGSKVELDDLKTHIKHFITNPDNDESLPEVVWKEDRVLGRVKATEQHVLLLQCDARTSYQHYFVVQNRLLWAYKELRNEYAQAYLQRPWEQCTLEEQKAIRACCPQRISEAQLLAGEGGVE